MTELDSLKTFKHCPEQLDKTARAIKSIAHPTRLSIVCLLMAGEQCVQEICAALGGSQSNTSQHLAILHTRGVLGSRKEQNRVFYRIKDTNVLQLVGAIQAVYCPELAETAGRF